MLGFLHVLHGVRCGRAGSILDMSQLAAAFMPRNLAEQFLADVSRQINCTTYNYLLTRMHRPEVGASTATGGRQIMDAARLNRTIDDELVEARARYEQRRPKSRTVHQRACEVMPGGNTRTVLYHDPFPLRLAHGEGAIATDADGHRYINLLGEYTAGLFGHSHPVIRTAIDAALDGGVNLGGHNMFEVELARHVVARFPAIERVRFTNSGTEANLMAIATARASTKRSKVLVFRGGYHGGLLYFGGGGIPINAPYEFIVAPYNDADATARLIRENASDLACVLTEAMMGSGGCIPARPDFLAMLREETCAAGALLVLDEVMTSRFGRSGAHGLLGLEPDLVTLGKWIGGGMSFGAFGGRADIMAIYDPSKPGSLPHAGTFNNNVLSMSAGIAALTQVFTPDVAEALHARGEQLRERLNALFRSADVSLQATGQGSLMNIHAVRGPVNSLDNLDGSDDRLKELVFLDLLERGFYLARRGFIALSLAVDDAATEQFLGALQDIVSERRRVLA
ncbi:aspartate aminotransferase family protein [Bosea sp. LjRoot237]|uniref:aspartate aminotransferase family protein n=1 Tax=Bosea sp. LjRoot237 TaxID=3342292 RepID=UPI003ED0F746